MNKHEPQNFPLSTLKVLGNTLQYGLVTIIHATGLIS